MKGSHGLKALIVILIIAIFTYLNIAGMPALSISKITELRFGIDIKGGVSALMYPILENGATPTTSDLESAKRIIDLRLENQGIYDKYVNVDTSYGRIIVEIPWKPGETDFNPRDTIDQIGSTAMLTFQEVVDKDENGVPIPSGIIVLKGENVKDAVAVRGTGGEDHHVALTMDDQGSKDFAEATARLVGKEIAIFMDEIAIAWPKVNSAITGGSARIDMGRTEASYKECVQLAANIKSGHLPFKLEARSVNAISPTLGEGALKIMIYAGVVAFILIALFMIIMYRAPGVVATIALFGLVVAEFLVLSILGISLTLPGIAGIILTVGMGVDANIVIYERIKDEIRNGKTLRSSVEAGFKRAFAAILDSNITTIIVAVVLMLFGSGSIKGFGITLFWGVFLSFLSAITASRLMLNYTTDFIKNPWMYGVSSKSIISKKAGVVK